ncbi:hypothetical protein [Bryobacter aggregatus]|uniref:hypothetical protein n=1 Tax=Bryobacter aggregatus TaxID=360054 RepID=UPI0004E16984|nr:hypothetical protein [Bryobacter aggregatus]
MSINITNHVHAYRSCLQTVWNSSFWLREDLCTEDLIAYFYVAASLVNLLLPDCAYARGEANSIPGIERKIFQDGVLLRPKIYYAALQVTPKGKQGHWESIPGFFDAPDIVLEPIEGREGEGAEGSLGTRQTFLERSSGRFSTKSLKGAIASGILTPQRSAHAQSG